MRVLAHIHTLNDAAIIDRTIAALRQQTRPVDGILVVDNGSTDDTLERPSLKFATVLCHGENLGTSGTVYSGFRFALEHGYDWIWVFDADSIPEPDALAKLLALYERSPSDVQDQLAFVSCLPRNEEDGRPYHGAVFTQRGFVLVDPAPEEPHYTCHSTIWSGCLYRLDAVRRIGLPNPDYVLDWGDSEYGYRVMKAGYKGFIDQSAVLHHNVRGHSSLTWVEVKLGPATLRFRELAPIRCYYICRNALYFALYDAAAPRLMLVWAAARRVLPLTLNFLLRPRDHQAHISACLRGLWHGVTGNILARH